MALASPRTYEWTPDPLWPGAPFVTGEGLGSRSYRYPHHLTAGDGRKIPFPLSILRSEGYWLRQRCRVRLFVEDGVRPRYPGVQYVMEIHTTGNKRLVDRARAALREITPGIPRTPQFGPVGQGIMAALRPRDVARESHWTERIQLAGRSATVRYDYLPG